MGHYSALIKGLIFAAAAGCLIPVQAVFNARAGERLGLWPTNVIVHFVGLVFTGAVCLALMAVGGASFKEIGSVPKVYLTGGILGGLIVCSMMIGVSLLGPGLAVVLVLTLQIIASIMIEHFGLFGTPASPLTLGQLCGVALMVAGLVVYKLGKIPGF